MRFGWLNYSRMARHDPPIGDEEDVYKIPFE